MKKSEAIFSKLTPEDWQKLFTSKSLLTNQRGVNYILTLPEGVALNGLGLLDLRNIIVAEVKF